MILYLNSWTMPCSIICRVINFSSWPTCYGSVMSAVEATTSFFIILLFLVPVILAAPCPRSVLRCGNRTLDIRYPFFTTNKSRDCDGGIYQIHCINLTPMIQLSEGPGQEFMYPVFSISYKEETLVIQDVKLSLSPYPWGSNCLFLYDFRSAPIPQVNVTQLSQLIISGGSSVFDCGVNKGYDSSLNKSVFARFYKSSSSCKEYNLYYTDELLEKREGTNATKCSNSGSNSLWFYWKVSFSDQAGFALLSAGFSPNWLQPGCFGCRITGPDCNIAAQESTCQCTKDCPDKKGEKKRKRDIILATSAIAATGGLVLACCFLCFLWYRHKKIGHEPPSTPLIRQFSSTPASFRKFEHNINYGTHVFSYCELQEATGGFDSSQEIGDGGFGVVYKGKLQDGRIVAVKRLYDNNCRRVAQFINEVAILSQLRHQNLVSLYGCTSHQSPELLLVYEFVPNGTVADHLHGLRADEQILNWPLRLSIAIETAQALAYLHAINPPIIHRDVKTNNILLDEGFHVKVADFGLSRLFPAHATHVSTAPQGTPGYLDPEYHHCYQLTDKSDVYSFGVVLVELISSKQAVDITRHRNEINLSSLALNKIRNKEMEQLLDPGLGYQSDCEMKMMITLVAELAFRCLQMDKEMRPPIKEVLEELKEIQRINVQNVKNNHQKSLEIDVPKHGDAVSLIKNSVVIASPDSVTEKWVSSCSTLSSDCSPAI